MSSIETATGSRTARGSAAALVPSATVGALAYVVGYLATWVLAGATIRDQLGGAVPAWKAAGWFYYAAHFVDLVGTRTAGPASFARTVDLIAGAEANLTVLYSVPPLVLLVGGAALAAWRGTDDVPAAALGGALLALGYGVLALLGAALVPHTVAGSLFGIELSSSVRPQLAGAVLLAGVVYPVVFGGIGGALGAVANGR